MSHNEGERDMESLFTTSVIGSFPRPEYLKEAFKEYNKGDITKSELNPHIKKSVEQIIKGEEENGLDIISDGEQGRTSFVNFIGDKVKGIKPTHITELKSNALDILKQHNTFLPYVRAVPHTYLPDNVDLIGDEFKRIKRFTKKDIKLTLPSPYLLMWETWHDSITSPYYKEPEDLGEAYIKIIRNEIIRLRDGGLNIIQIDEPMLGNLLEANGKPDRYRKIFGIINGQKYRGFKEELQLCTEMMKKTVDGISGIEKQMHVCHWPNEDAPNYGTGVEKFMPNIFEMGINNLILEYKTAGSGDINKLIKEYPKELKLSLGVIDVRDHRVETPEEIVKQVRGITDYISPENINLVPDCGFACGMLHKFPIDVAWKKINSMVKAADILRKDNHLC